MAGKDRDEHHAVDISPEISLAHTDVSQVKEQLKKFQNPQAGSPEFLSIPKAFMVDL